jgi:hypothetical protein
LLREFYAVIPICKGNPRIFSYKMSHDQATAPAVQNGLLTLAICRPDIRRNAKIGDIVLGIGGVPIGMGRVIFAAKVTGRMGGGANGPEYYQKHPDREDAIFRIDKNGRPQHKGAGYDHPQPGWVEHDVGLNWERAYVLLSTDYRYFGKEGERLLDYYSDDLKRLIVGWEKGSPRLAPGEPLYLEICQLLQDLWSQPEPSTPHSSTHTKYEDKPPEPDWSRYQAMRREYRGWEKANPPIK